MKKILSIIFVILWMILIFILSNFDANDSSYQSNIVVSFIVNVFKIDNTILVSFIVRKLAHFSLYLVLGILVYNMFICFNKDYKLAIILCMLYAISDEVHQIFVPGRSCEIKDILIDLLGSIIGIIIIKNVKLMYNKN